MTTALTPDMLVAAYAGGIFPMAEHRGDTELFWVDPRQRGVMPLDGFHISRSLRKTLRSERFTITYDTDFSGVVNGCANRDETWINDMLAELYGQLHMARLARSIEEIPRAVYRKMLNEALALDAGFDRQGGVPDPYSLLQRNAQTS